MAHFQHPSNSAPTRLAGTRTRSTPGSPTDLECHTPRLPSPKPLKRTSARLPASARIRSDLGIKHRVSTTDPLISPPRGILLDWISRLQFRRRAMPLLIGAGRVREEGSGRRVATVWRKRPTGFTHELEQYQQDRLFAEAGRRHFERALPGLAASLTARELDTISKILGDAIERGRKERRELAQRGDGGR